MKIFIYIIGLIFFICINSFAQLSVKNIIKVGILLNVKEVSIASDEQYILESNNKKKYLSAGKINISISEKKAIIHNQVYILPIKITSQSFIAVNKRFYRGNILVDLSSNNKLNIINEISVEDYLKGVLPKESDVGEIEALKTQAVISRSYVLKNLSRHSKEGFNVCSTEHCQVYGGASAESKACNEAIVETEGEVVIYNGKIAQTLFHANCGGFTEDPKYVWAWKSETPEYLKGRKDKYCKKGSHSDWTTTLSEKAIREKLIKAGYEIGEIKSIKASGTTKSKGKEKIIVKYKKGTLSLNSYKFRTIVDPWLIKSTMIDSIKKKNNSFVFVGKGWGHRVGLCQWGAKVMADKGFSYKKILKFYYPGTEIGKIKYEQ
ncbi:MAG: SpoIID/LytB domain-containing protein [Endomicrobiaceae bacterium]|nr:SpoIID/LytB domain-containing protein [Endomicrobiaceae bacterium]